MHQISCKLQTVQREEKVKWHWGGRLFHSSTSQLWTPPPLSKLNRAGRFETTCRLMPKEGSKSKWKGHTEGFCITVSPSYQLLTVNATTNSANRTSQSWGLCAAPSPTTITRVIWRYSQMSSDSILSSKQGPRIKGSKTKLWFRCCWWWLFN